MIKKLIYIIILVITISNITYAETGGHIQHNEIKYSFVKGEDLTCLKKADNYMLLYEKTKNLQEKNYYLQNAMRNYFLAEQANKKSIEAQIGLGRVYDEMNLDKYAQKHFYNAYNMDSQHPKLNLYFADYYSKRNDLSKAMLYYTISYKNGLQNNYNLNYQMAVIYEKLADIENAIKFYIKAYNINPKAVELTNKIRLLDELNYSQSQYYLFRK